MKRDGTPVFDIRHLSQRYGEQAIVANDDISLQVWPGEIFGLLGANGAGKSTLVKQMVNLLAPTAGEVLLYNKGVAAWGDALPLLVGYMPQNPHALNMLTVAESLYFTAHLRGFSRREAQQERDRLLTLWQMEAWQKRPSGHLSGGQLRLLRLAVAMAGNPPVLILDEPTNDLDPSRRQQVWRILRELNQNEGTTIIFITHDAIEAEKIIQRVGIMRQGRLVALGRPADLKRQVDQLLRLELFFEEETPPTLPPTLQPQVVQPGFWRVMMGWDEITAVFEQLELDSLVDFRLYSATLEDLYLYYASDA